MVVVLIADIVVAIVAILTSKRTNAKQCHQLYHKTLIDNGVTKNINNFLCVLNRRGRLIALHHRVRAHSSPKNNGERHVVCGGTEL